MTMQNTAADAGLEREPSADAAGIQGGAEGQEPDLGEQLGALIDDRLRARLDVIERRIQSFTDRTANQLGSLEQRIGSLAASGATTSEIRELVGDLHDLTVDPTEREKRALDRKLARLEKAAAEPARPPTPTQQQTPVDADGEERFYAEIAPDLEDYARLKGFGDDDLGASIWMARLTAAGAPQQIDYTPSGIRAYKDGMKRAMDRLAAQTAAARRPRSTVANVTSQGGAARDVASYARDARDGKPLPTAAEIDRLTARYLSGG